MTIPCVYHCGREIWVGENPHELLASTCHVCWEEGRANIIVRQGEEALLGLDPSEA